MKLVPYEVENIPGHSMYTKTKNLKLLEEFVNSGLDCAEVKDYTQKNATVCATSLAASIKNFRMTGVRVIQRKDRVFLIKNI